MGIRFNPIEVALYPRRFLNFSVIREVDRGRKMIFDVNFEVRTLLRLYVAHVRLVALRGMDMRLELACRSAKPHSTAHSRLRPSTSVSSHTQSSRVSRRHARASDWPAASCRSTTSFQSRTFAMDFLHNAMMFSQLNVAYPRSPSSKDGISIFTRASRLGDRTSMKGGIEPPNCRLQQSHRLAELLR